MVTTDRHETSRGLSATAGIVSDRYATVRYWDHISLCMYVNLSVYDERKLWVNRFAESTYIDYTTW